jgi:hypothetical protein
MPSPAARAAVANRATVSPSAIPTELTRAILFLVSNRKPLESWPITLELSPFAGNRSHVSSNRQTRLQDYVPMMYRVTLALLLVLPLGTATAIADPTNLKQQRAKVSPTIVPNFNQPDLSAKNDAYTLSADEQKLDCKKLNGHMQIRIRQLRSTRSDPKTSALARGMQQATTPFIAGTTRGINPDGDNARDLSMLQAYNGQLAAKGCPSYDLNTDLAPGATHTPRPIPKVKVPATATR